MTKLVPTIQEMTSNELRLSQMLKALGNPLRFRIMQFMADHPVCITGDIVEFVELAQSTVSQHLKVLREAGLIRGEIEGPATCYCIDPDGIQYLKSQIDRWLPNCCAEGTPAGAQETKDPNCSTCSA